MKKYLTKPTVKSNYPVIVLGIWDDSHLFCLPLYFYPRRAKPSKIFTHGSFFLSIFLFSLTKLSGGELSDELYLPGA